jgi:hypothetical protein
MLRCTCVTRRRHDRRRIALRTGSRGRRCSSAPPRPPDDGSRTTCFLSPDHHLSNSENRTGTWCAMRTACPAPSAERTTPRLAWVSAGGACGTAPRAGGKVAPYNVRPPLAVPALTVVRSFAFSASSIGPKAPGPEAQQCPLRPLSVLPFAIRFVGTGVYARPASRDRDRHTPSPKPAASVPACVDRVA